MLRAPPAELRPNYERSEEMDSAAPLFCGLRLRLASDPCPVRLMPSAAASPGQTALLCRTVPPAQDARASLLGAFGLAQYAGACGAAGSSMVTTR